MQPNYWEDYEAFVRSTLLSQMTTKHGKWEMYLCEYNRTPNYEGGEYMEFYLNGQLEHEEAFEPQDEPYYHVLKDFADTHVDHEGLDDDDDC